MKTVKDITASMKALVTELVTAVDNQYDEMAITVFNNAVNDGLSSGEALEITNNRMRTLIGEIEMSDLNTPADQVAYVLADEADRIGDAVANDNVRFMHEMRKTY